MKGEGVDYLRFGFCGVLGNSSAFLNKEEKSSAI